MGTRPAISIWWSKPGPWTLPRGGSFRLSREAPLPLHYIVSYVRTPPHPPPTNTNTTTTRVKQQQQHRNSIVNVEIIQLDFYFFCGGTDFSYTTTTRKTPPSRAMDWIQPFSKSLNSCVRNDNNFTIITIIIYDTRLIWCLDRGGWHWHRYAFLEWTVLRLFSLAKNGRTHCCCWHVPLVCLILKVADDWTDYFEGSWWSDRLFWR